VEILGKPVGPQVNKCLTSRGAGRPPVGLRTSVCAGLPAGALARLRASGLRFYVYFSCYFHFYCYCYCYFYFHFHFYFSCYLHVCHYLLPGPATWTYRLKENSYLSPQAWRTNNYLAR